MPSKDLLGRTRLQKDALGRLKANEEDSDEPMTPTGQDAIEVDDEYYKLLTGAF